MLFRFSESGRLGSEPRLRDGDGGGAAVSPFSFSATQLCVLAEFKIASGTVEKFWAPLSKEAKFSNQALFSNPF